MAGLSFAHPAQQIVLQEQIDAIAEAERRRDRLGEQIRELVPAWSLAPVVAALQAMRGVAFLSAVVLTAEVGDFRRFANPRQLMAPSPAPAGVPFGDRIERLLAFDGWAWCHPSLRSAPRSSAAASPKLGMDEHAAC